MTNICPQCEQMREIDAISAEEDIVVRGEAIRVPVKYFRCGFCGEEFINLADEYDPLDAAYREYRRHHGMMQPEEIRALRKRYGLTQKELCVLLGWGGATLSRYENGALQDEAHDRLIQFIREPSNLRTLIRKNPGALTEPTRKRLEASAATPILPSLKEVFEEQFATYEPDITSGYLRLDLSKLYQAAIFLCGGGVVKTKLNKLLFYADFKHFREYAVPITGARYVRLPYGPVPDHFEYYYAALVGENLLAVDEIIYSDTCAGEKYTALVAPDLSLFSDTERMVLNATLKHFQNFSAKRISELSHREKGYEETPHKQMISYDYAKFLLF